MKNVRTQMLNGQMSPPCMKCYKEEAAGLNPKENGKQITGVKE